MLSREMAQEEFSRWLNIKKIKEEKVDLKEKYADAKETLISGIADGRITIDEKGNMTVKLNIPLGDNEQTDSLTFKPRMQAFEMDKLNRCSTDTAKARAFIEILTGQLAGVIRNLDSNDMALCNEIVVFYYLA